MSQFEVLVLEFMSKDGLSACSIESREITSLSHKSRDDAMKDAVFEPKRLTRPALSLLSSTESPEVLCCGWSDILEQLKLDSSGMVSDLHVKVNARIH